MSSCFSFKYCPACCWLDKLNALSSSTCRNSRSEHWVTCSYQRWLSNSSVDQKLRMLTFYKVGLPKMWEILPHVRPRGKEGWDCIFNTVWESRFPRQATHIPVSTGEQWGECLTLCHHFPAGDADNMFTAGTQSLLPQWGEATGTWGTKQTLLLLLNSKCISLFA